MALYFNDQLILEISQNNDIVDVISQYVKLKKNGSRYLGLCPFHKEKTPSFTVSPDKQLFHCFGCGAGGTVINFVMKAENLDFIDGVKFLAEKARIAIPDDNFKNDKIEFYEKKQNILEINKKAARFFYDNLKSEEGKSAYNYLINRKISENTQVAFGLGYSKNSYNSLLNFLTEQGYKEEDIFEAGLIQKSDKGYYDKFRNRLMFPIFDTRNNIIGFGGRVLDDSKPKYLNSPETIVFNKSQNLYALNFAKNSTSSEFIIVEGYMDVISLHQNGFINAVASLGTAFTQEQAKLIKKYKSKVIVSYDSDDAGISATVRAIEILANEEIKIKVLTLRNGKDPDEFINNFGANAFEKELSNSKNYIEFKIDLLKNKFNLEVLDEKIEFINEIAKIFAQIENEVEREVYILKISNETSISADSIIKEVKKSFYKKNKTENTKRQVITAKSLNIPKNASSSLLNKSEKMLLHLIISDNKAYKNILNTDSFNFSDDFHQMLFNDILEIKKSGREVDGFLLITKYPNEYASEITAILDINTVFDDNDKAFYEIIKTIEKEKNKLNIKNSLKDNNIEEIAKHLTKIQNYNKPLN